MLLRTSKQTQHFISPRYQCRGSGLFKKQGFKGALIEAIAIFSGVHSIVACELKKVSGKEDDKLDGTYQIPYRKWRILSNVCKTVTKHCSGAHTKDFCIHRSTWSFR